MGNTGDSPGTTYAMSQRFDSSFLANQPGLNFRQLCRRFGISANTVVQGWRQRYRRAAVWGPSLIIAPATASPRQCPNHWPMSVIALRHLAGVWAAQAARRLRDCSSPRCGLHHMHGDLCAPPPSGLLPRGHGARPRLPTASSARNPPNFAMD